MVKNARFISIRIKITAMTLLMIVFTTVFIGTISYYSYRRDSIKLHSETALAVANAIVANIDADKFSEVSQTGQRTEFYWQFRNLLNVTRAKTGVSYLYAMAKATDGLNYKYIHAGLDTDEDSLGDLDTIESYGAPPLEAYDSGKNTVSGLYENGSYGYLISAFVPVINSSGTVVGLVCADISADDIMASLSNYKNRTILISSTFMALFAIISVIYTSHSLGNPITQISELAKRIVEGDLSTNAEIKTNDEIAVLADSFMRIRDTINRLILSISEVSRDNFNGKNDSFIDIEQFSGDYRTLADEINGMIKEYTSNIQEILATVTGFGEGNFDVALRDFPGGKKIANIAIETLRSTFKGLNKEISVLATSAANGELSVRIDSSKYNGDWKYLVNELNELLSSIRNPISESISIIAKMADGDFSERVRGDYKGDFGLIKNSLNLMLEEVSLYISEISYVLRQISEQNLKISINRDYVGEFSRIKASIITIIDRFNSVLGEISSSANQVALEAKQISDLSCSLAQGSTEQAGTTEELNASIEQLGFQATANADTANKANNLVMTVRKNAEIGSREMKALITAMKEINESSKSILKITKTIDDIAFQTNLLALNAAVESASAGSHGKGFMVVADEVRRLSSKSKAAAQETADLIEDSVQKAYEGMCVSEEMAKEFMVIVEQIEDASALISVIAEASTGQSINIDQITNGIAQISQVTQANTALSEESAAASEELSSQAEIFRNEVSKFILKDF